MTEGELRQLLIECLSEQIRSQWKGQVLYSGIDTIKRGPFYFLGLNPRSDSANVFLCDEPLNRTHWSAYTQQCWRHPDCNRDRCPGFRLDDHQQRVQNVMRELRIEPEKTFATNFIFVESEDTERLKKDPLFNVYKEKCWQVNKRLLATVKPEYIICLGNDKADSAFSYLYWEATRKDNLKVQGTHRDLTYRKRFDATFTLDDGDSLRARVIGIKHPSYPMSAQALNDFIGVK
jgi:hypothetical protein